MARSLLSFHPMGKSYQAIQSENGVSSSMSLSEYSDRDRCRRAGITLIAVLTSLLVLCLLPLSRVIRYNHSPASLLNAEGPSYCKTTCLDPCASHASVYGELCCDYSTTPDGKTCGLVVRNDVCTCLSDPSSLPIAPPMPPSSSRPSPPSDDDAFSDELPPSDPFKPSPPYEPFDPFRPFQPIEVPGGAVPCSKACAHACAWSHHDGQSHCCDRTGDKCVISQIGGKCFCSS